MAEIGRFALVCFIASVATVKIPVETCFPVKEMTICRNISLKANEPLEIPNYQKTLKLLPPIQEIPPRVFMALPNLENLIINYTLMERIYSNSFYGLRKLRQLDLYWNQIPEIPPRLLHNCRNLVYLNLGGNNLEYLDKEVFVNLKFLRTLIISSNLLTAVPDLENLDRLEVLDMSKNKLRKLAPESFKGLTNLLSLNLKGNQLKLIERDALLGLVNLQVLNLERNELNVIYVLNIKENLKKLHQVRLGINNFSCEILEEIIEEFATSGIVVPEGLAEPGPISRHGIFCLPQKQSNYVNNAENNAML